MNGNNVFVLYVCVQMHACVLGCVKDLILLLSTLLVDCLSLNLRIVILSGLDGQKNTEMPCPFSQYPRLKFQAYTTLPTFSVCS